MPKYLTDSQRPLLPVPQRQQYRFWLEFDLNLVTRSPRYRRWFPSLEDRNAYILDLPKNCAVVEHGEDPT